MIIARVILRQIELTFPQYIDGNLPSLIVRPPVVPPFLDRLELSALEAISRRVRFAFQMGASSRERMLIEPDLGSWRSFLEEQQIGRNVGVGFKHSLW